MRKLVGAGIIQHDETVVGILTGTLLKDSQTGIPQSGDLTIDPNLGDLRKLLADISS